MGAGNVLRRFGFGGSRTGSAFRLRGVDRSAHMADDPGPMTDSDALLIARWCWPGRTWREGPNGVDDIIVETDAGIRFKDDPKSFLVCRHEDVSAAESVLLSRGHAVAYGRELWIEFVGSDADRFGVDGWARYAWVATAPLDCRVRALAAVIRELEAKKA